MGNQGQQGYQGGPPGGGPGGYGQRPPPPGGFAQHGGMSQQPPGGGNYGQQQQQQFQGGPGQPQGGRSGPNANRGLQWVSASDGFIPDKAVQGGVEKDGAPLFVARAMYKGGLHPGKAGRHIENGGCAIGFGHKEVNVREYQVLCGDASQLHWVKQDGQLSIKGFKPVEGGHEDSGEPLYIAKTMTEGSQQLGKCAPHIKKGMSYPYGHKELTTENYMATAGLGKREEIFGNLEQVSKYRPTFFAIAKNYLGESKLQVNPLVLRSKQPLNVAKMQDKHWSDIRHKIKPPVDKATMAVLEERARTGIIDTTSWLASEEDRSALERWTKTWVKMPPKRQIIRYYRTLLEQVTMMEVKPVEVPNTGKYVKSMARRNTVDAVGREKPDLVPKKSYVFTKSLLSGKRGLGAANLIDMAGLDISKG
ncbi:hypothetical protein GGI19_002895 [Coemansia pectinata]|uniref:Uncharacterized protein n=1 Tax=Coemansia pectinata TaxID=1052879 RepID=A0A9W8GWH5_9FUNG|nr:hypothetical protein GGI19_002895 [Coemansia pectinata]